MSVDEKSKELIRAIIELSKESSLSINELGIVIALERIIALKSTVIF